MSIGLKKSLKTGKSDSCQFVVFLCTIRLMNNLVRRRRTWTKGLYALLRATTHHARGYSFVLVDSLSSSRLRLPLLQQLPCQNSSWPADRKKWGEKTGSGRKVRLSSKSKGDNPFKSLFCPLSSKYIYPLLAAALALAD